MFGKNRLIPGPYSQHSIFFVTYEWVPKAVVFVLDKLFLLRLMRRSSLLGPFIGYEENEVL